MISKQHIIWLLVAIVIIALDQWTKGWASTHLQRGVPIEVLPVFKLSLQHNPGAAFSFLADAGGWQRWFFVIVSSLISVVLLVWILRLNNDEMALSASLSLILAGAVGNLWDRIELGYVVDFISVHYQSHYFPAFNIADTAITVGAGLMILDMLINPDNHSRSSKETPPDHPES